jgi:hypothetical protein
MKLCQAASHCIEQLRGHQVVLRHHLGQFLVVVGQKAQVEELAKEMTGEVEDRRLSERRPHTSCITLRMSANLPALSGLIFFTATT